MMTAEVECGEWTCIARCEGCGAIWQGKGQLVALTLGWCTFCPSCKQTWWDGELQYYKAQPRTEITETTRKVFKPWTWFKGTEKVSYWVTKDGEVLRDG